MHCGLIFRVPESGSLCNTVIGESLPAKIAWVHVKHAKNIFVNEFVYLHMWI